VAVLEGRPAGIGGANSIGVVMALEMPLVVRLKYLSSICGETIGSGTADAATGPGVLLIAVGLASGTGAAGEGATGGAFVLAATSATGGGLTGAASGGGRVIRTKLVTGGAGARKRKGTGPTTGK
jgi:hypothetical protein